GQKTQTLTIHRAFTPDYASPEQIRGEKMTTASDIYSLGVLLYELLSGRKPYKLKSSRIEELATAILTQEPVKPSSAWTKPQSDRPDWVQNTKSLKGDLDSIVLKALRKEPEKRYASVAELSEDLSRYLAGLPV